MSGVFGAAGQSIADGLTALCERMAQTMSHMSWHVAEWHADAQRCAAIGRVGIGLFNKAQQPIRSEDGSIYLAMAGEFYEPPNDKTGNCMSHEQAALAAYRRHGDTFASHLNGTFIVVIWDAARRRIIIANDRFATYTLFYAHRAGSLIFAHELKGVLCSERVPRTLDYAALAQYVRFQQLLGMRTFFEEIKVLPAASALNFKVETGELTVNAYWSLGKAPMRINISIDEAAEEAGMLLRRAVVRQSSDELRPGVYLSGGLDSRTITGMVTRRPLPTATYGVRGCRDVVFASQISSAVGGEHHWFELRDGYWVLDNVDLHLRLTEGQHSWIHAHGLSTLNEARTFMDVNLSGWDGGVVMAFSESPIYYYFDVVDDDALLARLFYGFNQLYTWPGVTEAEEHLLYTPAAWGRIRGLAFDTLREELCKYEDVRSDLRGMVFYIRNHCERMTQNHVRFHRAFIEMRFPFFDYELTDFTFSLPTKFQKDCWLYRKLIQRETPSLALIPWDNDEYLPTTSPLIHNAQKLMKRVHARLQRYLPSLFKTRHTLYADYENYLRGELRPWAESLLSDERTLGRGLFEPAAVRSLMKRHMSNNELWTIGKIAPLITYEMVLRQFCD